MSQNPAIDLVRELILQLRPGPRALAVADWTAWPLEAALATHDTLHLQDALAQELVEVGELRRPNVPTVQVVNKADVPVLFPMGALLQGGAQTRIIATPTLVLAKTSATIDVRCVEAGRWETFDPGTFHTVSAAPSAFQTRKLRRDSRSRLGRQQRADDQAETWRDVDAFLSARATTSRTASLLDGVEETTQRLRVRRARQASHTREETTSTLRHAAGVAVARPDDQWSSWDVFGTATLAEAGTLMALSAVEVQAGHPAEPAARPQPMLADTLGQLDRAEWSARPHGPATLVDFALPDGASGTALVHANVVLQLSVGWAA